MKLNAFVLILSVFTFWACESTKKEPVNQYEIPEGDFIGFLDIQGQKLPFEFSIRYKPLLFTLKNGEETFNIENFTIDGDSITVPLHIFDTELKAVWIASQQTFKGHWIKKYVADYKIDFTAKPVEKHESNEDEAIGYELLEPKYRVFFESMLKDSTVSIAEFSQSANDIRGTFLTTTGDYRYLRGNIYNQKLKLYTFDGEHAFVFTGQVDSTGIINGNFYSGKTWHETWTAYADSNVKLADASSLTFLKDGFETLNFKGLNLNGDSVSLKGDKFKGKAVLVQIMGTWCPNCMDETAFLSKWYKNQKPENLEIVSLAFERKDNFKYAKSRLETLKKRYQIEYPLLFAGGSDKEMAAKKLPALSSVIAYPTLIFINKQHKVSHIHTGFNGPGTGHHYEKWKLDFEKRIEEINQ